MTRYSIAICDDEEAVRSIFHDWVSKAKYDADVKEYSGGDELIKDIDAGAGIDILFLDIAMGKNDGIETAKELGRRIEASGKSMRASRPLIVFVTGIPDRMGDAFGVKAFDYLLKPVSQASFESELHRAVEELQRLDAQLICETKYQNEEDRFISIQSGKGTINIKLRDILYIESSGRKAIVHLPGIKHEVYRQMNDFEDELGNSFFRVHRGYLVNMRHIKGYSRSEVQVDNGDALIMSKYKYADFIRAYMEFIS